MDYENTFPGGPFRDPVPEPKGYDTALVCAAGHLVNANVHTRPQHNARHCSSCGQPTISACPSCDTEIRGEYHVPGVAVIGSAARVNVRAHCHDCGKPYPWTEARLKAANDLMAEFDKLDDDDRAHFAEALPDLLADTPNSTVSAVRVKRLLTKAGEGAKEGLWEILKGVATSGASKLIWGA